MEYTAKQIENARKRYNEFIQYREPEYFGSQSKQENELRAEQHNNMVAAIINGDKELEKKWKKFFLNDEVKKDRKEAESKAKLQANKEASADILAPIKKMRKLGDFGKWLNTAGNPFRKQHFSKKYTVEAVNAYLSTF